MTMPLATYLTLISFAKISNDSFSFLMFIKSSNVFKVGCKKITTLIFLLT